jgi:crossover junction endodeoxyribonuclease RusA
MSDTLPRLILPYPVSANRYWRSFVPKGWTRATVHVTPEAKAYKAECGWIAKAAGIRAPVRHAVALEIVLVPANGVCMDLDNALKVSIDALKDIVYFDDKQVRKIIAERREPDGKARLEVQVSTYVPPAPGLFADVEMPAFEPPPPAKAPVDKVPF